MGEVWSAGWPAESVRTVGAGPLALAVVGVCGASEEQLEHALAAVRARRWRELTRWPGSYLAVARSGDTLAVIGDLSQQHPVFYRPDADGVWWGTSAAALAALDGAPVAPVALAAQLALGQADILPEQSLFRQVRRVPTGHLLEITPEHAQTVHYEPISYPAIPLHEAAPTVQAALAEAVAARLDDRPVSADLAGLDSTTLACLAARHTQQVTAVTFADERLRDDDVAYATRTAAAVAGLKHLLVPGGPDTVYYSRVEAPDSLPFTDAPNAYAVTAGIKQAVMQAVLDHQGTAGVHLTGSAGDGVLSAPSTYLSDLLRTRQRRRAWQHAQGHARLRNTSVWEALRSARPASRATLTQEWQATARALRRPPRAWQPQATRPVAWSPLLDAADWMHTDIRHQLADALTDAAGDERQRPEALSEWTDSQDLARVGTDVVGWRALALEQYGLDLHAPYLDNEVRRACLAVPAEQRGTPGRYKPLLAAAFNGTEIVPDFVLGRITKGGYSAISHAGLLQHASVVRSLLGTTSRLGAMGLVSSAPVATMLERAVVGQPLAKGALHTLVAAEVWLRQLETTRASWWEVRGRVAAA